jgi:nucleoside-diphosphate-sugar epimerase
MQKIVITGATGMIGSSIAKRALETGADVLCVVRKESGRLDNIPKSEKVKIVYAAQEDYSRIDISGGYDIFYHLAWDKTYGVSRDDVDTQVLNIQYALDAARLAKRLGCKKFVGAGSQAEYGLTDGPMTPETPCFPSSGYGVAKHAAGLLAGLCCRQLEMQFNWVRILSVFGPLDGAHTLIMYAIDELRAGRSPEFTKCEQIWDYLYCDDAAKAILAIGENGVDGKIYPLGSGRGEKLSDYLESIRNIIAPGLVLQFGKKEYYPHQPMYLRADISELTADTGWKPEFTFEDGINRILQGETL